MPRGAYRMKLFSNYLLIICGRGGGAVSLMKTLPKFRRRKTVDTAVRFYGGPSEKFVGVAGVGGNLQKLRPNFSEVAFM